MTSSPTHASVIDVFAYDDYRTLLGDYYVKKKEAQPYFSYRAFARRTGFRAPNHLQRVVNGDRKLSPEAAMRYAQAMGLDAEEQDYFCTLVERQHASEEQEIERLTGRLLALRRYHGARRLDEAYAEYHSRWYIPAIFEMFALRGFVADPRWIAPRMRPPIAEEEAARALAVLKELHLVKGRRRTSHAGRSSFDDRPRSQAARHRGVPQDHDRKCQSFRRFSTFWRTRHLRAHALHEQGRPRAPQIAHSGVPQRAPLFRHRKRRRRRGRAAQHAAVPPDPAAQVTIALGAPGRGRATSTIVLMALVGACGEGHHDVSSSGGNPGDGDGGSSGDGGTLGGRYAAQQCRERSFTVNPVRAWARQGVLQDNPPRGLDASTPDDRLLRPLFLLAPKTVGQADQ